jgi:hypothetical protein
MLVAEILQLKTLETVLMGRAIYLLVEPRIADRAETAVR